MAVDTRSLVYLIDPFWQGENINGKPLVGGYMEVYVAGTDTKYTTWSDWDGARHPFRIPLKSDGRACILVEPQFTYDCYLYDSFGNLACSRLNVSPDIGGDVSVLGLTQVFHDETISGNGTPYEPLGIVSGGKTYEGILPIVVNNTEDKISANHVALGVQEPLYFVQDDEEGCIIGFSGQTIPEGVMSENALGFENNKITGYNGSAFSAGDELPSGVMNTSALEYNAVNEISAYNGSAIAQYGAEKQWLVHDDTLVHVANSAQFALGVNLSAVAQLLGVDETVLFDNDKVGTSAVSLSESRANFKELKLYVGFDGGYNTLDGVITKNIPSDASASWLNFGFGAGGQNAYYAAARLLWDNDTSFKITNGTSILKGVNSTAVQGITVYNSGCQNCISKVIGIGRKQ